jgi:hypothetical protein
LSARFFLSHGSAPRLETLTFGLLFRIILSNAEAADQWEAMIPLMVKTGLPPLLACMARRGTIRHATPHGRYEFQVGIKARV